MHLYEKSGVCCTFSGLVSQHSCISACRQWNCTSSGLPSAGLSPFDSFLAICSWCWPMHGLRPDSSSYRTMPYENMSTWNTDDSNAVKRSQAAHLLHICTMQLPHLAGQIASKLDLHEPSCIFHISLWLWHNLINEHNNKHLVSVHRCVQSMPKDICNTA